MSAIDLSVCIVNWNGCELLRNLLPLLSAACSSLAAEIIVVDNASDDGSTEMVAAEFPDVILMKNTCNLGFSKANNQATKRARGRLLLFLNNDTLVRPDALSKMVFFLDQHPEVAAVGPRLIKADGNPRGRYTALPTLPSMLYRIWFLRWTGLFRSAYHHYRRGDFDPNRSQSVVHMAGSAVLVRSDQFVGCGRWDEGFEFGCEDFDLSARLKQLGALYYLAEAEIVHLGGISSRANFGFFYRGFECGCARYLSKHSQIPYAPWIYKLLVTIDMPVRIVILAVEGTVKWLKGERERARRIFRRLSAACEFMFCNLARFWRS